MMQPVEKIIILKLRARPGKFTKEKFLEPYNGDFTYEGSKRVKNHEFLKNLDDDTKSS